MKNNHIVKMLLLSITLTLVTLSVVAQKNYALRFNATSDLVLFENTPLLENSNIWTVEMWVKKTGKSNFSTILDGDKSKLTLETWRGGNDWQYKVGYSLKGSGDKEFDYVVPLNKWVHLAFVSDGTSVALYVNGDKKGRITTPIPLPLKSFGLNGNPNESPKALIDEVRIWDRVLTADEITTNMSHSININSNGLIAYWYFDDRANPITDLSKSGIVGQIKDTDYIENDNTKFTTTLGEMKVESVQNVHRNEYLLQKGAKNQELLCIVIETTGVKNPLTLSSVGLTLEGTSKIVKVGEIGVRTSGKNPNFASSSLLGTKQKAQNGTMTFSQNVKLQPGKNYFWIAADIASTASNGEVFDANCVAVTIDGKTISPTPQNPKGNRIVSQEVTTASTSIDLIPRPNKMEEGEGVFELSSTTKISYNSDQLEREADFLAEWLRQATGYALPIVKGTATANTISLQIEENTDATKESYQLKVSKDKITIIATQSVGVFWGIQSLRQLFPVDAESKTALYGKVWNVPIVTIEDTPRFDFRGMHLDVGRHFFPPSFVKKYIDLLSMYKFNVFHWHLTEDQGWRMEIKSYPKLQEISAWRICNGKKYGGYYTQKEMKEIVAYAAERHISIIPELELPGHSVAALAAYPELGCTSGSGHYDVRCQWGIAQDIYCCGKEKTFEFLENVLSEIVEIFPYEYIHIGGDEAPKARWKTCTDCQKRKADLELENEEELQKYFVERIGKFLATKNRKLIGWSEITHGGVPENAVVQDWAPSGRSAAKETVESGNNIIMSNNAYVYLDYRQTNSSTEMGAFWAYLTLKGVYDYEPIPSNFSAEEAKLVLGVEGCMWTEYTPTEKDVEYMVLPRLWALSEVAWTQKSRKDWANFKDRVLTHYARIAKLDYNSRKPNRPRDSYQKIESCRPIVLEGGKGQSYFWNDVQHSTTPMITVDKSGVYKCYRNVLGDIVETTFDVLITSETPTPTLKKKENTDKIAIIASGKYHDYFWYQANEADTERTRLGIGKEITRPATEDLNKLFVSGVSLQNNTTSLQLDGKDDIVKIASSDFLNNTKQFTFESWIKINKWSEWGVVMNKLANTDNRIAIELGRKVGEIYVQVAKSGNAYGVAQDVINIGEWTHIAVVFNGKKSGNANRLKLYINGMPIDMNYGGAAIPDVTPTVSRTLQLGEKGQNPAINYAEVRYWNVARTEKEVAENKRLLRESNENLKLYFPMNELGNGTIYDLTHNVQATLQNSTTNGSSSDAPVGVFTYGCETTQWQVSTLTNVESISDNLNALVFPNPTNGKIIVKKRLTSIQNISVSLFSLNGQLIQSYHLKTDNLDHIFNFSTVKDGTYLLEIKTDNQKMTKTMIFR